MKESEKYYFFLNPYTDAAFTKCPKCDGKTKVKKFPLVIFIEKTKCVLNLNKTCKYCPYCELIIAKKVELKPMAEAYSVKVEDFFIYGTLPIEVYKQYENRLMNPEDFHKMAIPFKDVWKFEVQPAGWYPISKRDKK